MQTTLWNGLGDLICCDEPESKLIYIGSIIVLQLWETLRLLGLCLLWIGIFVFHLERYSMQMLIGEATMVDCIWTVVVLNSCLQMDASPGVLTLLHALQ